MAVLASMRSEQGLLRRGAPWPDAVITSHAQPLQRDRDGRSSGEGIRWTLQKHIPAGVRLFRRLC